MNIHVQTVGSVIETLPTNWKFAGWRIASVPRFARGLGYMYAPNLDPDTLAGWVPQSCYRSTSTGYRVVQKRGFFACQEIFEMLVTAYEFRSVINLDAWVESLCRRKVVRDTVLMCMLDLPWKANITRIPSSNKTCIVFVVQEKQHVW